MRVRLYCENLEAPVSPFVARFVANVCVAIATSLKTPAAAKLIEFSLRGNDVRLQIDGAFIPLGLNQGFAETMVRGTLRGMVHDLKGMDLQRAIRISVEFDNPR
jgi:hypothetical protein